MMTDTEIVEFLVEQLNGSLPAHMKRVSKHHSLHRFDLELNSVCALTLERHSVDRQALSDAIERYVAQRVKAKLTS
jgi:hypothetical protein